MLEGRVYSLRSEALGGCPRMDWHIVVEANDILAGMISLDNLKTMGRATGTVDRRSNTFSMTVVEMGGRDRRVRVTGRIAESGMLIANIEGPNVSCYSVVVRALPAVPDAK
jgi:hypothetical protein